MPRKKAKIVDLAPENNILENANNISVSTKKKGTFPYRGPRNRGNKILPSHRILLEEYKKTGYRNLSKAIRKTGVYSNAVITHPNVITKTKSWQALMEEHLPNEKLAIVHNQLLNKRAWRKVENADGTVMEVDDGPDTAAASRGLEMAYKLKGAFNEKKEAPASTVMYNLFYKPEIREQMKTFEEGIKQSLYNEVARKSKKDMEERAENRANLDSGGLGDGEEDSEG